METRRFRSRHHAKATGSALNLLLGIWLLLISRLRKHLWSQTTPFLALQPIRLSRHIPPRPPTPTIGSVLPSKQIPKHKEQIQKGPPTLFASINGDVSTHKAPTMVYSPANMDARLGRDSQFANADASLEAWATLPPEIRNPDLRDFVCRSIMQPHFVDLCKALENVWETTLLEPRLRERDL